MGGRAAEQIVLGQLTTGASDDIRRATNIARRMVCEWGMSERLGPLTFGSKEEFVFLGREISQSRDYSEKTAIMIDEEVRGLVEGAYNRARQLLSDNLDKLHVLSQALLEREILDGDEVEKLLRGEQLEPLARDRGNGDADATPAPAEAEGRTPRAGPRPSESPPARAQAWPETVIFTHRSGSWDLSERARVVGILNVTPDSFSDGGRFVVTDQAVAHAEEMVEAGADCIDVGGQSTRPGAGEPVGAETEWTRIGPVIGALTKRLRVPLSVDTYWGEVARRALEAGVAMVNDVSGLSVDRADRGPRGARGRGPGDHALGGRAVPVPRGAGVRGRGGRGAGFPARRGWRRRWRGAWRGSGSRSTPASASPSARSRASRRSAGFRS